MNKWIKKYGQFIFSTLFFLYFLYTVSNALDNSKEIVIAVFMTILLYVQSFGVFFYFYKKIGRPRVIDWLRISLFLMLVLNFMSIVNSAGTQTIVPFSVTTISLNDAPFTMLVIMFAFFSLDLGYMLSKFIKVKQHNKEYYIKRKGWVFGILIFSTTIQAYMLFTGFSGFGTNIRDTLGLISLFSTLSNIINPLALVVSAYIIFIEHNKNKIYVTIFYVSVSYQILLGLLSGMKEAALIPILYVGIVFLVSGRKFPKKLIYIGLFLLLLLYPVNNSYRNVINNPHLNTGSSTLNMVIALKKVFTAPLTETLLGGAEKYADRGEMYPFLQYSINIEPSWGYYKYMTRYIALPVVWLIPRTIWPDKPRGDIGGVLYEKIVGVRTMTAVTPLNIGWAYLEGGLLYVIIIFIILGILFSLIGRMNYFNPIILLFYVIVLHKSLKPEWDPYFLLSSFIQMYIIYWIVLKFIGIKKVGSTQ